MSARRLSRLRRRALGAAALSSTLLLGGCGWSGLNSLPLPGTQGTSGGAYDVTIVMPDVSTLTQNSPVMIDNVTVGSIRSITLDKKWHAVVKVGLNKGTKLPENAYAKVGQASLLGSDYIQLMPPPPGTPPQGQLSEGDTIPLRHAGEYPTTEGTLSSLSVVLNGGGIAQIQDITRELNAALDGNQKSIRDVLPQLNDLVGSLDRQRGQIVGAMDGLNRLSGTIAQQNDVLAKAMQDLDPATGVLAQQKQHLSDALTSLGHFTDLANQVITKSKADTEANLKNLQPILKALGNTGNSLTNSLSLIFTFPFPMHLLFNALHGDYTNLYDQVDLTVPRLNKDLFYKTPLAGKLGGMDGIVGQFAGKSGEKGNPFSPDLPKPQSGKAQSGNTQPGNAQGASQDTYGPPAKGAGK